MSTATRPANFVEGADYPSPVTHVIGLGFYDGVTNGVLKTADGSVYAFDLTDEQCNPDGLDRRTFDLVPLSASAFDALVGVLEPHLSPRWPCWVPLWKFPTEDIRLAVEAHIDRVLAEAASPTWRVTSDDLMGTVSASSV